MKIKAVIFDFDGTIAATNQLIIDSWQHTYLSRLGRKGNEKDIIESFGEPLEITMAKVFPQFDLDETLKIYREFQYKYFKGEVEAFPGMVELIKRLKNEGYKIAVVTSRKGKTTHEGLDKFGVLKDMEVVVTCDDTDIHKPNPEPILLALERLNVEPSSAIMVGDSIFDTECAKNAGVKSILVDWSVAGQNAGNSVDADFLAKSADEIKEIIESIR